MNTLKSGLEMFIKEVEKLSENTVFNMRYHSTCVIGQTVGWKKNEQETLKCYFGIETEDDCSLFSEYRNAEYSDEQWIVIRLFTSKIGENVSKQDWLEFAKFRLEVM